MHFKSSLKFNTKTQTFDCYYRLIESYRDIFNDVKKRTLLNVGIWNDVTAEQLNIIRDHLNRRADRVVDMFEENDEFILHHTNHLWHRLISEKKVQLTDKEEVKNLIYANTLKHTDAREIGSEWICSQAYDQLELTEFFKTLGWNDSKTRLTQTQIVSRAVYPASELKTARWIKENSAICDITHYPASKINKDKLYRNALALYKEKDKIEEYLSTKTNELFDIQDKIVLYDLTNTYFEGRKDKSKLAQFGRSKEKRSDCKLVVLAMVVNIYGFIKYSNIYEGNTTDSSTLPDIIDKLRAKTSEEKRAIVVIDAGIATKENLKLIVAKGYDYVCVNRVQLKDYKVNPAHQIVKVLTKKEEELELQRISLEEGTDYYLKIKSPGKTIKETSMLNKFEEQFIESVEKIKQGITKKNAVKSKEAIDRKIGRITEKYPQIARLYKITTQPDDKGIVIKIEWKKDEKKYKEKIENLGIYFLRTNLELEEEEMLWDIYNTIREIESAFRTLKTDLDLRPIYHKNDDATMAHLHLGLLAYWLVNTIRYQLKSKGVNHCWKEIIRIGNTQKFITSTAQNKVEEIITIKKCTEPKPQILELYTTLKYKTHPFKKTKSVGLKNQIIKNKPPSFKPT